MKRYMAFAFDNQYPSGGMNDRLGTYDTIQDALDAAWTDDPYRRSNFLQVWDTSEDRVFNFIDCEIAGNASAGRYIPDREEELAGCAAVTTQHDIEKLLRIAHSTNAPTFADWNGGREFSADDGWRVLIGYDHGRIEGLWEFTPPEGRNIEVLEWEEIEGIDILQAWKGLEDTERLIAVWRERVRQINENNAGRE